jgi:hypothetical protein
MTYYVDGFVLDRNPSPRGGGFTVVNEHNKLIINHTIFKAGFTNNDGELLAIAYATYVAAPGDTIITDSQCAYYWSLKGETGPRRDLRHYARYVCRRLRTKSLQLQWHPRGVNLAGHYNEAMERP